MSTPRDYVRLARPQQWYKNGIVLVPLVFSGNTFTVALWSEVALVLSAFCLLSGAAYAANDVLDRRADRHHPRKRDRPVARGAITVPAALGFATAASLAGLLLLVPLGVITLALGAAYLLLQVLYNVILKALFLWDAITVAAGFVIRALAGTTAIDVGDPTEWLIVGTFLFALHLAFAKRRHEMSAGDQPARHRTILATYTAPFLDRLMQTTSALVLAAYSLYTFFGADRWMMFTLPFAFYGMFRYDHLVAIGRVGDQAQALFRDRPTVANAILWLAAVVAVFEGWPQAAVAWLEGIA